LFTTDPKRLPPHDLLKVSPAPTPVATKTSDTLELRDMVSKAVNECLPSAMKGLEAIRLLEDLIEDVVTKVLPDVLKRLLPRAVARYIGQSRIQDLARRYPSPAPPRIAILADTQNQEMHKTLAEKYVAQVSGGIEDNANQHKWHITINVKHHRAGHTTEPDTFSWHCEHHV
jgi:hypothetical protein